MTDHDLEAATQRIMSLCTRIMFESDMLKLFDPELPRETRHSLTIWSSDPVMKFSESAKVAQVHAIPSTTWTVCSPISTEIRISDTSLPDRRPKRGAG